MSRPVPVFCPRKVQSFLETRVSRGALRGKMGLISLSLRWVSGISAAEEVFEVFLRRGLVPREEKHERGGGML